MYECNKTEKFTQQLTDTEMDVCEIYRAYI